MLLFKLEKQTKHVITYTNNMEVSLRNQHINDILSPQSGETKRLVETLQHCINLTNVLVISCLYLNVPFLGKEKHSLDSNVMRITYYIEIPTYS